MIYKKTPPYATMGATGEEVETICSSGFWVLWAALLLCASCAAGEESTKYDALPEIFSITVETSERKIEDGGAYVYKEYVTTVHPQVNQAAARAGRRVRRRALPTLQMDPRKKGKRGSALNIDTVYYRTGTQYRVP